MTVEMARTTPFFNFMQFFIWLRDQNVEIQVLGGHQQKVSAVEAILRKRRPRGEREEGRVEEEEEEGESKEMNLTTSRIV